MLHADEGLLHTYIDGELEGADRDRLLAHLNECAECRGRLQEAQALVARAGELLNRTAPPRREAPPFPARKHSPAPSWRVPAAWAATVTIAFVVGWYAQGERLQHELAAVATPPEATQPVPTQPEPRAPAARAPKERGPVRRAPDVQAPIVPAPEAPARAMAAPDALAPTSAAAPSPAQAKVAVAPLAADQRAGSSSQRQDAPHQRAAAPAMPMAASEARAPTDEFAGWPPLDAAGARTLLGRAPALLPGRPVHRMARSPAGDGVVLIEQEWTTGVVLRLYERRAVEKEPARGTPGGLAMPRENLARYVNSLRVEIAGPLPADSLARLLDSVE